MKEWCSECHIHKCNFEDLKRRKIMNIWGMGGGGVCIFGGEHRREKLKEDVFSRKLPWNPADHLDAIWNPFPFPDPTRELQPRHALHGYPAWKPSHFAQAPNCTKWLHQAASATEWLVLGTTHYSDKDLARRQAVWHEHRWDKGLALPLVGYELSSVSTQRTWFPLHGHAKSLTQ